MKIVKNNSCKEQQALENTALRGAFPIPNITEQALRVDSTKKLCKEFLKVADHASKKLTNELLSC